MKLYAKVKINGKWTFVRYMSGWTLPECECRECQRILSSIKEQELVV